MNPDEAPAKAADPVELLSATLQAYRSALTATGKSASQSCPPVGSELQQNLARLENRLAGALTVSLLKDAEREVGEQLELWEDRTEKFYQATTTEVKELLILLARTAESGGERDQHYTNHFSQFTSR